MTIFIKTMYDTVHLRLKANSVSSIDFLSEVSPYINITNEGVDLRTEESYVSGYLDSYRVSIRNTGVSLKGSLSKFYFDDPLKLINRNETKEAIQKLSDCLHIPMKLADVSRLDVTKDIELKYKPETYYKYLGVVPYFNRFLQQKSLSYTNSRRQLFFYNKIAELKAKKTEFSKNAASKNIMRIEYRLMKGIRKLLKMEVKGATLFEDKFYESMVIQWYNRYKAIHKIKPVQLDMSKIKNQKDFIEYSALQYWEESCGGQIGAMALIDELKELNAFKSSEYYSRAKRKIRSLSEAKTQNVQFSLLEELNQKVDGAYSSSMLI